MGIRNILGDYLGVRFDRNDITDASSICDCNKAYSFISNSKDYENFKSKCKMSTIEEILDMLDLYFRYDWAVTEKRAMIALFLYYFISCSKFLNILSSKNSVIVISNPSHNFTLIKLFSKFQKIYTNYFK